MRSIEEQATGCVGAHSYKEYAHAQAYKYVEVLNWTSSAGDWEFLVSKNKKVWFILYQNNSYPRPGFSHAIDTDRPFYGTLKQVYKHIEAL